MVLLMEAVTPRGVSGARRYSPVAARHAEGGAAAARSPLFGASAAIAEESAQEQQARGGSGQNAENVPPPVAKQLLSSCDAAACSPLPSSSPAADATPCRTGERRPLTPLGLDALSLVALTPLPFAASRAPLGGAALSPSPNCAAAAADVDLASPLPAAPARDAPAELVADEPQHADCAVLLAVASSPAAAPASRSSALLVSASPLRAARAAVRDSFTSPVVACAFSAATVCENLLLVGIGAADQAVAAALPRVRLARQAATQRAASLAATVTASLGAVQASLDGASAPAWVRHMLEALELEAVAAEAAAAAAEEEEEGGEGPAMAPADLALLSV